MRPFRFTALLLMSASLTVGVVPAAGAAGFDTHEGSADEFRSRMLASTSTADRTAEQRFPMAQPEVEAATTEGPCYETLAEDPFGDDVDGIGDVGAWWVDYDCVAAGWDFWLFTYDNWVPADDLYRVYYSIDKDLNDRTGCAGFELGVVVENIGDAQADVTAVDLVGGCEGTFTERYLGVLDLDTNPTDLFVLSLYESSLRDTDHALLAEATLETFAEPEDFGDRTPIAGGDACPFMCYELAAGFGPSVATMFRYGRSTSETFVGDWDGDGIDTIGVRMGNEFFLSNSQTGGRHSDERFRFGSASDQVIIGDWDGDGVDTIGVRRANEFFLVNSFAGGRRNDHNFRFGSARDDVYVGDWNGDDLDTIGVRKGNTFYLSDTFAGGRKADQTFSYGSVNDPVVVGDWNGNGRDTLGVRKGATWYLSDNPSTGRSRPAFDFGRATHLPFAGDWDGDGIDTPGVRR